MADLGGVEAKLKRAESHITELQVLIGARFDVNTDFFRREEHTDPSKYVYKIDVVPKVDPEWKVIIGETIFNMRSALDHLAQQLVEFDKGTPDKHTQFPIRESIFNEHGKESLTTIRPGRRSRAIVQAVEAVQPYQRGHDFAKHHLWILNHLSNIDKHRLLLSAVSRIDPTASWWGSDLGAPPISPQFTWHPLEDGDEVASFEFGDAKPDPDFDPHLSLTVSLDEGPPNGIIRIFPVVQLLAAIHWYIGFNISMEFAPLMVVPFEWP